MRVRNLVLALLFFIPVSLLANNGPVETADKNDASVVMNDDAISNDLNLEEGATDEWRGWGRGGWGRGWGRGWGGGWGRGWGWGGGWGSWGGWGLGGWGLGGYGGWYGSYWPYYGYSWPYYGGWYW